MAIEVRNRVESKKMLWTGRTISGLITVLLLMDAVMKIAQVAPVMEGTVKVGYPASAVLPIGIILLGGAGSHPAHWISGWRRSHELSHQHSFVFVHSGSRVRWRTGVGRIVSAGRAAACSHPVAKKCKFLTSDCRFSFVTNVDLAGLPATAAGRTEDE